MAAQSFHAVPDGTPSLREAYEVWAEHQTPVGDARPQAHPPVDPTTLSVGIVGGGISGLYAALLLKAAGASVHVFEEDPQRLGGRVFTYRFDQAPNQYFEAGAMRLPEIPEQQPVFDLIEHLNGIVPPEHAIETMPYVLFDDQGDLVYVNARRGPGEKTMSVAYAADHPDELGFPAAATGGRSAAALLDEVIGPLLAALQKDFEKGFAEIVRYDDYSFRSYLAQVKGWSEDRINYVEVMTSQTNQFQNSFTELVIENMDFSQAAWKTIRNGMDRLPNAMAEVLGRDHITMGARVVDVREGGGHDADGPGDGGPGDGGPGDGRMSVQLEDGSTATFDKVLMALPPAALRMIRTPTWSAAKTHAIRALHFEPLYKIGIRFKSRFWESVTPPARGGQSITDLPSRWFVYPSYGIGDDGPGVLLLYTWMTDAVGWLPQDQDERIRLALRDLQTVYGDAVDVHDQYVEAFDVSWTARESTGDAMFFPGQFRNLFNIARQPEGNVYFAGEHLSVHHTWIVGAIDSALLACQQMLGQDDLAPLGHPAERLAPQRGYDYSAVARLAVPPNL